MKIFEEVTNIRHLLTTEQNAILDLLKRFGYLIIDEARTKLYQKNNFLIIEIFSVGDKNCPFTFDFGIKENTKQFRFYLNESAPIIEVKLNDNLQSQTTETIIEFLRSEIFEELTFVDSKLLKAKYKYYALIYGERKLIPHVTFRKMIWFWQKKRIKLNKYEPWIK